MRYCYHCGCRLEEKYLKDEGMVPYCPCCKEYRFPIFSTAVSMVILNEDRTKTLLVKQYGKSFNRLVAGYINKGEAAEEALKREMLEEVGLVPIEYHFQKTKYFSKSNTLLINFYVIVSSMEVTPNYEIDSYAWYDVDKGIEALEGASLAKEFYTYYIENNR